MANRGLVLHRGSAHSRSLSGWQQQLGVAENLLYRWKQEHLEELEASKPDGAQSPKEMAAEIADLRKQLAKSQRMNEILKKTVGYFSKED